MTKTVAILGAGASFDYGLPTGETLLNRIAALCKAASGNDDGSRSAGRFRDVAQIVLRGRVEPIEIHRQLSNMAHLIEGQMPPSIDWFLGQEFAGCYGSFRELGLLAIAWCIGGDEQCSAGSNDPVPREADSAGRRRPHWYKTFWQSLAIRDVDDFQRLLDEERLRVVTFNYERTFEQFLLNRLQSLHLARTGSSEWQVDVRKQLEELDVCHVYGSLGDLNQLPLGKIASRLNQKAVPQDLIREVSDAANRLRVIARERTQQEDANFSKARKWIAQAERVVFLGFGFDDTNVKALGFPALAKRPRQVFATTYGLGAVARDEVCRLIVKDWVEQEVVPNIRPEHQSWDIDEYLRHFQPFRSLAAP